MREHLRVFPHVGLLFIKPPGPGPHETGRVANCLVFRQLQILKQLVERTLSLRLTTQHDHIKRNRESKEVFAFDPQVACFSIALYTTILS